MDDRITITVKPSGTIVIHGAARIVDLEGTELVIPPFKQPGVIKLCGCGRSANRPFCDGSHKRPLTETHSPPSTTGSPETAA